MSEMPVSHVRRARQQRVSMQAMAFQRRRDIFIYIYIYVCMTVKYEHSDGENRDD